MQTACVLSPPTPHLACPADTRVCVRTHTAAGARLVRAAHSLALSVRCVAFGRGGRTRAAASHLAEPPTPCCAVLRCATCRAYTSQLKQIPCYWLPARLLCLIPHSAAARTRTVLCACCQPPLLPCQPLTCQRRENLLYNIQHCIAAEGVHGMSELLPQLTSNRAPPTSQRPLLLAATAAGTIN